MDSQRLIKILIHPFFIGFVITIAISILAVPKVNLYKVDIAEKRNVRSSKYQIYFSDLDSDQNSEEIQVDHNPTMLKILIKEGKGIMDQYNLRSKAIGNEYLFAGDYNLDGFKEVFVLTTRGDSLLLSIIDPLHKQDIVLKERLIYYKDSITIKEGSPNCYFLDLMNTPDGISIVFAIAAGYSIQPRNVFKYNISKDELQVSPLMGVSLRTPFPEDLDGDSIPEILFSTVAVGNYDSYVPYTDQSAWLMALNKDLEFLFEPLELPKYPSHLHVASFRSNDSAYIVALHEYFGADSIVSGLYLFNARGKQIQFRPIEQIQDNSYHLAIRSLNGRPMIYVLNSLHGEVQIYDKNLIQRDKREIPVLKLHIAQSTLDIDLDGTEEHVFLGERPGLLVIFRENFKHPLVVDLKETELPSQISSYMENGKQYLYAKFGERGYILNYQRNPFYYFKFPLLALIYLACSFLIQLIYKLQKYRAERDYIAKRKMNELQILSLKNQIEPHFTFNILNSIGSLYTRNTDPKLAYNVFVKYSNLLRFTIKNSDRISIPIEEELEFVNTYVELEQFRCGNAFNYQVDIDKEADLSTLIPRMLIHTFVENAIKHGVRLVKENALLEVEISRNKNSHHILIRDNGPGLNFKTDRKAPSTGKGLQIIDEMLDMFYQLGGVRIKYTLEDISLRDPRRKGSIASIKIPN